MLLQHPVWINQANCGGGHVNWNPVTYEGTATWDSHSGNDDDYNMRISRPDQALYTANDTSSVNIDHFSVDAWWKSFHAAVDSKNKNPSGINGRPGIVIGLVGLDYEHGGFTELHP